MGSDEMAHADLTQADHELLVRIAREHALKAVAAAERAVSDYAFLIRQEAEQRVATDESVIFDPDYGRVLDVHGLLGAAKNKLGEVAGSP
jgi:hypothetical protein